MPKVLSSDSTPPQWSRGSALVKVAITGLITVIALGLAVTTVVALSTDHMVKAGLFALFTLIAAGLGATVAINSWHARYGLASGARRGTDSGRPATVLTLSAARWFGWLSFLAVAAACGWWDVLRLLNRVPWTDPATEMRRPAAGFILLAIAVAAVVACYAIARGGLIRRDGGLPGLSLSEQGIHQRAQVDTILGWEAISAIEAAQDQQSRSIPLIIVTYSTKSPGVYRSKRGSVLATYASFGIRPSGFAIGAPRVLSTLQFYLAHPELRHELGTQASTDRIRANPTSSA